MGCTSLERLTLLDLPLDNVTLLPDRLVVSSHGALRNVAFSEIGLRDSEIRGVGGAESTLGTREPWDA